MSEQAEARRMRLLGILAKSNEPIDLTQLSVELRCDERTIRRDLDLLQQTFQQVQGIEVRRGRVLIGKPGYHSGYFADQMDRNIGAKEAIAKAVVASLPDNTSLALTAGSTTFAVAREIRRSVIEDNRPRNLIAFTNGIPALQELVAAGVSTGVVGEIFNPEDCALHTQEYHSSFQPGVVIVGASGILYGNDTAHNTFDLFTHRAEEAAFLKQLIAGVSEIIVVADNSKLGCRHPWSFGGKVLQGKKVRLVTDTLSQEQHDELSRLAESLPALGIRFQFQSASPLETKPT